MSEIPLHAFGRSRKNRAGYTALPEDEHSSGSSQANGTMPSAVRTAAAATARAARQGRQTAHYQDDPDEEATLLGDVSHDHEDAEEVSRPSRVSVLSVCSLRREMLKGGRRPRSRAAVMVLTATNRERSRSDRLVSEPR